MPTPTPIFPSRALIASAALLVGAAALSGCKPPDNYPGSTLAADYGLEGGTLVFSDDFDGDTIGDVWQSEGDHWVIEDGWLSVSGARNDALWLQEPLPENVRIEFKARALSEEGDLKFEIFGDGATHESGYICIFGGWDNQLNIIARQDEHGEECGAPCGGRIVGADGQHVEMNRIYTFTVVRTDQRLRWFVDGEPFITYDDPNPLVGDNHDFFGFNDWDAPLQFDEVRVYDLDPDPGQDAQEEAS